MRYLTPYNFIIAAKQSPINSHEFDATSEDIFNRILAGRRSFDDLTSFLNTLKESICR